METKKRKPIRNFDTVVIRDIEKGVRIVVYDERTVYVKDKLITYAFHRWFHSQRGFYIKNWRPFVLYLKTHKNITFWDIMSKARELDIVCSAGVMPDLTAKKCRIIK